MNRPALVTITGIDVDTDLARARELCARYPLEFAMLCDPEREGRNARVPEPAFAAELARHFTPDRLAFHLCGAYAGAAMQLDLTSLDARFDFSRIRRLQVNTAEYSVQDVANLRQLGHATGCSVIVQNTRSVIPFTDGIVYLDDQSAGRGVVPDQRATPDPAYLAARPGVSVGYAGGLSPGNLAAQLAELQNVNPTVPYWIDAASGVRNKDNRLDLDMVETFLDIAMTAV